MNRAERDKLFQRMMKYGTEDIKLTPETKDTLPFADQRLFTHPTFSVGHGVDN